MLAAAALALSVAAQQPCPFFARLYSDRKAHSVGDILHIIVAETTTATQTASRSLQRQTSTTVGPGIGWLDFLRQLGYQGRSQSKDKAVAVRSGSITARITVRVIEVLPNGNLLVEGRRQIVVNRDKQTVIIRGEVRPRDIRSDNTVYSYNVANLTIQYSGSDPRKPGKKVGIITRLLNLLF